MKSLLTGLVAGFFLAAAAPAQILMSGGTYVQNFDSLANSGNGNGWTDNVTLPGWYASTNATSVKSGTVTLYNAGTGSSSSGGLYSFGDSGATDRALGSLASGTPGNFAYGVRFTNDTATTQTNFTISYTGEEWRVASTNQQKLAFMFQIGALLTNSDAANVQSWTAFAALDFNSPNTNLNGNARALAGNDPTNRVVFTNLVLTGVTVPPGQEIFFRWYDLDDTGSDDGLALDNLTISFSAATNSPATNVAPAGATQARILRIATYNIAADFTNNIYPTWSAVGPPLPGLIAPPSNPTGYTNGGVLAGIGEELLNGNAQPLDILSLEETTSNLITVAPIVNALNTFYGLAGMYSNSSYQATESGNNPTFGNGPNAVVFNTRTVQLLASVPVDPPGGAGSLGSSSGEYREVMRYQFAPAGVATNMANVFYIYVSHYKSGAGTTAGVTNSRNNEAIIVRSNQLTTLPAAARILHVGDFNTGDASEPMYATLTASGTNQLLDPLNPARSLTTNFDSSTAPANLTESATYLQYRDDYQMMTTNVYYGSGSGLALVPGTYRNLCETRP